MSISDEQVVKRANAAVKRAIEKKQITDSAVVVYDRKTQFIYKLNSDGSKVLISDRKKRGRYSERIKAFD